MSLVGGALTLLLPETAGENLPQTLLDGDLLGRGAGRRSCLRRNRHGADPAEQERKELPA